MHLHERVKEVRLAIGLSQAKFAERMAISSSYFANLELNNQTVTERVIRLISAEYNVNANWLRTGEGNMFNEGVDEQISKLVSVFNSLSQHFKECALEQIVTLADLFERTKASA